MKAIKYSAAKIVFALFLTSVAYNNAQAEDVGVVDIDWISISASDSLIAREPDVSFLDFRLGMSRDEVEKVIAENSRFTISGSGDSTSPRYLSDYRGRRVVVRFPDAENYLLVKTKTEGTQWDAIALHFTPGAENQAVFLMQRSVVTDDRSLAESQFWASVKEKYGDAEISSPYAKNLKEATFAWGLSSRPTEDCKAREAKFSGGEITFGVDIPVYNVRWLEGVKGNFLSKGCATIVKFAAAAFPKDGKRVVNRFSAIAVDFELVAKSYLLNKNALELAEATAKKRIDEDISQTGTSKPEL